MVNFKPKVEFPHSVGSLIRNPQNETDYGVFIKKLNNNLFFFRLQDDHLPVFSKTDLIPNLVKTGTINDNNNQDDTNIDCAKLKRELLKYYRTRNLDKTEKILLSDIMTFAFPNGIPHYDTEVPLSEKEVIKTNLNNSLEERNAFLLHTPLNSTLNHLNEKTSYLIEKTPDGVWVVRPSPNLEDSNFQFLFYNDKSLPSFGGISRMEYSPDKQLNEDTYNKLYEIFNNSSKLTELNNNGEIVKIEPETRQVLLPDLHKYKQYSPQLDKLLETEEYKKHNMNNNTSHNIELINLNNDNNNNDDDEYHCPLEQQQEQQQQEQCMENLNMEGGGKSKKDIEDIEDSEEFDNFDLEEENRKREYELFKEETEDIQTSLKDTFDDYDKKMINLLQSTKSKSKSKSKKSKSKQETDQDTDQDTDQETDQDTDNETEGEEFEFEEFEFDEDEIEIIEVVEKQMIQEKEEKDKFYNENQQISELNKLFINQYPFLLRNNDFIINTVKKRVNDFMNIKNNIVMNKQLTEEEKQLELELNPTHNTLTNRPLLYQYATGNLKNNLLIPLVIHKKKIYIDETSKYDSDNYNETFVNLEKFYNELN